MRDLRVRGSSWLLGVWVLASIAGCVDAADGAVSVPAAVTAAAGNSRVTYTPDEWAARCAEHVGTTALCRELPRAVYNASASHSS